MVLRVPDTLQSWQSDREKIRSTLRFLLGDLPPRITPKVEVVWRKRTRHYNLEKLRFDNGAGSIVPGYLALPRHADQGPVPVVHYCHLHGGRYELGKEEIFQSSRSFRKKISEFIRLGFAVAVIDSYGFGERQGQGPAGKREKGLKEELSLSKYNLWLGRTLWGMMLRDEFLLLDYLVTRSDLDAGRIATMGMSMGSTKAWWIAALDERVKATVAVACLTRYQNLIELGNLNNHNIYYYVPNMLKHFDTEAILGLIPPRALLTLTGTEDGGSPVSGINIIDDVLNKIYALFPDKGRYQKILYSGIGHRFTAQMWDDSMNWLELHL